MTPTVIGVLAILIGLLACFAGYRVFRVVLPILGFLVGLGLGAQVAAATFGEPYLDSPLSWVIAIAVGLVAAAIAFIWWYASVALAIGGLGYAIGFGAASGMGAEAAVIIGLVVAVLFAVLAILLRIPIAAVIVVTAFWGASALIGGTLVLLGRITPGDLRNGTVDVVVADSVLLVVIWFALGVMGIAVQWFTTPRDEPLAGEPVV